MTAVAASPRRLLRMTFSPSDDESVPPSLITDEDLTNRLSGLSAAGRAQEAPPERRGFLLSSALRLRLDVASINRELTRRARQLVVGAGNGIPNPDRVSV